MANGYTVATILIKNQNQIYAEVNKVKTKADLENVTKVVEDILNKNKNSIRDKAAMIRCVEYLRRASLKSISAYTGTLVTFMGGGKI